MPEHLLNVEEAAKFLGISSKDIEDMVAKGKLPAYKIGGAFLRFRKEHLESLRGHKAKVADIHVKNASLTDRIVDFFYFYSFYIISLLLIAILVIVIVNT